MDTNPIDLKGYATDEKRVWKYPPKDMPPTGVKIHIIQEGGVAIHGTWVWNVGYVGWDFLQKRDLEQEEASLIYQRSFE